MKIANKPNVSFKAQFVLRIDPKQSYQIPNDKFVKRVDSAPKKTNNLLKFLGFLQSKEGSEILNKLPNDDVIRLEAPFFTNWDNENVSIEPYFIYEPSGLTEKEKSQIAFALPDFRAEGRFLDASRKMEPQFKKWVNDLVTARKTIENK